MRNSAAGLGDPYWYEWSVGLDYVVQMLDAESNIASVTLQQTGQKGLDWTKEWLPHVEELGTDAQKLRFMRAFRVHSSEEGLAEIGERLIEKLAAMFKVDEGVAVHLRALLDSALRTWTTSLREGAEAITREVAYERLCLVGDVSVGEHDLPPPAPFFGTRIPVGDLIASLLESRAAPVVFLVGEPGSGKTALISSLANRADAVIDVRYHAYRPITPENQLLPADAGRTTSSRALWSDLLLQIRALGRGRLAQLQVPVHTASLSVDDLRAEVVRLADKLGKYQERPFVIAIDGIDHAARAGVGTESLLSSLVPPDQVPFHVAFLIGGQPPEGNPSYPVWLRAPTSGVRRIDLPMLEFKDTLELVRARLPKLQPSDQENAARDIWENCQGLTLSTVFAVEEAVLVKDDPSQLPERLADRQLASRALHVGREVVLRSIASLRCFAFVSGREGSRIYRSRALRRRSYPSRIPLSSCARHSLA